MSYASLGTIRRGNWLIKASVFDDQILIIIWNDNIMYCECAIFYNEEVAYNYIEEICNGSTHRKISNR